MLAIAIGFTAPKVKMATRRLVMNIFFPLSLFSNCAVIGSLPHVLANELPPEEYRSELLSIHWSAYYISVTLNEVILPYWINITKLNIGGQVAWFYAFSSVLAFVFVYFVLPETRGLSLTEIDLLFNAKVAPRRSSHWISEHRKRV